MIVVSLHFSRAASAPRSPPLPAARRIPSFIFSLIYFVSQFDFTLGLSTQSTFIFILHG